MRAQTEATIVLLLALLACKSTSDKPTPADTASVVQPPAPSVAPAPPAEPARHVLAAFKGDVLQECTEFTVSPTANATKIEELIQQMQKAGLTRIGQRCESLGRVALGSCERLNVVEHTYADSKLKTAMAECLKAGGKWAANTSPEAELEKAQQELQRLQGR